MLAKIKIATSGFANRLRIWVKNARASAGKGSFGPLSASRRAASLAVSPSLDAPSLGVPLFAAPPPASADPEMAGAKLGVAGEGSVDGFSLRGLKDLSRFGRRRGRQGHATNLQCPCVLRYRRTRTCSIEHRWSSPTCGHSPRDMFISAPMMGQARPRASAKVGRVHVLGVFGIACNLHSADGASAQARPREVILGNLPPTLWRRSRSDAIGTTRRRACIEHARLARPFMRSSDFDERRMAP